MAEAPKHVHTWPWLKIKQEGQTAGVGNHVSTHQGSIVVPFV